MQVHFGTELLVPEWQGAVACIGTFDGVHLGHREVISRAIEIGRDREMPVAIVTFDRHPAMILRPESCPKPISSLAGNIRIFESLGASLALILPFDLALSKTSAAEFFQNVLCDRLRSATVVVGHDFAFGHNREGTADWLRKRIETTVVPPFMADGIRVSSTRIREAISLGDFRTANRLLGRSWAMAGIVVAGQKLGRTIGFPTINLARSFDQIMPRDGIYAGRCETPFGEFKAAISVGFRPTVGGDRRAVEAYLLDYPGDSLYGRAVRLRFAERVRDEAKFDSIEEMKKQIVRDVEQVARIV